MRACVCVYTEPRARTSFSLSSYFDFVLQYNSTGVRYSCFLSLSSTLYISNWQCRCHLSTKRKKDISNESAAVPNRLQGTSRCHWSATRAPSAPRRGKTGQNTLRYKNYRWHSVHTPAGPLRRRHWNGNTIQLNHIFKHEGRTTVLRYTYGTWCERSGNEKPSLEIKFGRWKLIQLGNTDVTIKTHKTIFPVRHACETWF